MRYYAAIEKGEILEVSILPHAMGYPEEVKIAHPDAYIVEISAEDHELVHRNLEWFTYRDGKIRAKSPTERARIEQFKADWRREHTIGGLQEELKNMRGQLLP